MLFKNLKPFILSSVLGSIVLITTACGAAGEAAAPAPQEAEPIIIEKEAEVIREVEVIEEAAPAEEWEEAEEAMEEEAMADDASSDMAAEPAAEAVAPQATAAPVNPTNSNVEESPAENMTFESEGVNPFIDTEDDHLSTFAMDVDTASYSVARRYLADGYFPPQEAIRIEEFINYFDLSYPAPTNGDAFAIHMEAAPAPFGSESAYLLKIDLQGKEVAVEDRKDANLTFVVDVSGSMNQENRLGLVKESLRLLVNELQQDDKISLVIYGSQARVILEPTSAANKNQILSAIDRLHTDGSTNAEAGLRLGYQMAAQGYEAGAINRVILLSDGVANVGQTGPEAILNVIRDQVSQGVTLSTIGVGMGNYNDVMMEQLANDGNGNYNYVDTLDEAHRIFVENLTGTLQVIAKDAKIQVDFNPDVVRSYRLLGYENRAVADQDFRNDRVDAGEVGAGHTVTALYEIKLHDDADIAPADVALTTRIRYQDIDNSEIVEVATPFERGHIVEDMTETSAEYRFIAAVAEYAEILRGSYWAQDGDLNKVQSMVLSTAQDLGQDNDMVEFITILNDAIRVTSESGS